MVTSDEISGGKNLQIELPNMTLKPTESKHLLRPDQCVNVLWTGPKLYLYHTRWRKLNEHQRKMIWAQHHMRDKRNYSILTIRIDKVSFLLSWSANIHTLWIQWCLRMINQLMWHLSWNPSGLLTDSIFEMQLPSLTRVLAGRLSWCFSKEDQAF